MKFGNFRRSTPTAGLEIILDLMPIPMYLKKLAFMAFIRLRNSNPATWDGIGKNRQIGHLQWLDRQHKSLDIPKWPIDSITPETDWHDK